MLTQYEGTYVTVMIVDDNAKVRSMIRNILSEFSPTICECSDGSQAVELYSRCTPDWVFMDIVMKRMDGITATENIVRKYPDANIMIVTNFDDQAFRDKAKKAGAKRYILKENLTKLIQEIQQ